MKKLLLFLAFAAVIGACSNDFEVTALWKEVPVVYAILSVTDTAQYVRVEKAFLDPEKSALEIAQIADSLYYPENAITVWLEQVGTQDRVQLQRVDGNLEGYVRDQGIFADQPNWLYKAKDFPLEPGGTYRLRIQRADGKPDVTAETTIPKNFTIRSPALDTPTKITFNKTSPTSVEWRTDENGVYFNVSFKIAYRETLPDGTLLKRDTLEWHAVKNKERTDRLISGLYQGLADVDGGQLFKFLVDSLPPTDNLRYFERASMQLVGGGKEIKEFNLAASANTGITSAEVFPTYTNISEGFGLFTSKNRAERVNIQIQPSTVDSMNLELPTRALNFRY